jgi:eukaryotic-like serine/threonine-protein kinase
MEKKLVLLAGGSMIFIIITMLSLPTTKIITQTTFAQTNNKNNNNNNSTIYENPTYGIKLQHPSDWKTEEGTSPHFSVSFIAPQTGSNSDTTTPPALIRFGVDNLPSKDFSLEDFTNVQITGARQTYPNFTLYQSHSTTLAGNPAQQLVFSTIDDKQHEARSMQVFTIKDNKSYHITYIAKPERYSEFLPIAQKMINSFEFI